MAAKPPENKPEEKPAQSSGEKLRENDEGSGNQVDEKKKEDRPQLNIKKVSKVEKFLTKICDTSQ